MGLAILSYINLPRYIKYNFPLYENGFKPRYEKTTEQKFYALEKSKKQRTFVARKEKRISYLNGNEEKYSKEGKFVSQNKPFIKIKYKRKDKLIARV